MSPFDHRKIQFQKRAKYYRDWDMYRRYHGHQKATEVLNMCEDEQKVDNRLGKAVVGVALIAATVACVLTGHTTAAGWLGALTFLYLC